MTINSLSHLYSDETALTILAQQIRQKRIELRMTQAELAKQAGISKRSLERLEAGGSVQLTNFIRVLRPLGLLENILALLPEEVESPIEQLKAHQKKQRQRVSPTRLNDTNTWTWGDDA